MSTRKFIVAFSILTILFLVISPKKASALPLELTVMPTKQVYNVGEKVYINGNLTNNGLPVSDAIVAVEVDNPKGDIFVLRTLNTGPIDPTQWPIEILNLFPCDSSGNPQYSFQPGGNAGFKVTARNKAANPYDIKIILSIVYSNKAPCTSFSMYTGSIGGGQTIAITTWPVPIPGDAVTGNTTVYANIYNQLPRDNGWAYCPEKSASFMIGTGPQGESTTQGDDGQFTLEIALSQILLWLGNYSIYASVKYSFSMAFSTSTFEVILIGDVHPDGKIDMRDIAMVARAFGTKEGDPDWNPELDLYPDGKIDMRDIAIVAKAFGTRTLQD